MDLNRSSDRIVSAEPVEDDLALDLKLRPQRLNEFIGQRKAKEQLPSRSKRQESWRGVGPRAPLRPSGAGQNHAGQHYRQ